MQSAIVQAVIEIVLLKVYCDGGNVPDSRRNEFFSFAAVAGVPDQWRAFNREWNKVLEKHKAPFLHTTDVVSCAAKPFTKEQGWTEEKSHEFLTDCVLLIDEQILRPCSRKLPHGRPGLYSYIVTVPLKEYIRAREENPEVPQNVTEIVSTQAFERMEKVRQIKGAHFLSYTFDRNEPYRGHLEDRRTNKKASRHLKAILEKIVESKEADMRETPALQMADLYAWCFSHREAFHRYEWQRTILRHRWFDEFCRYDQLKKIIPGVPELVKSWGLPPRRPTQ